MADTVKLTLGIIEEGQVRSEIVHNENMAVLDALVQAKAISVSDTPPVSPVDGDAYILGGSPTGVWVGHPKAIATYYQGWRFVAPSEGMICFVTGDLAYYVYRSAAWRRTNAVADDAQTFSATPTKAQVEAFRDKFNVLLAELRSIGVLKT